MPIRPFLAALTGALLFAAPRAFAHPGGHVAGLDQSGLSHLLTDPYHLVVFGASATLILACLEWLRRRTGK
ncbi:MAG: hypothetical protein QNJ67_01090 [Kiloniellales bacterium]|nr:hypothetical protein [Kiloniellales bacterium]